MERFDVLGEILAVFEVEFILAAVKQTWGDRVTTVFVRQGKFAHDPKLVAAYPPADLTVECIGDLLNYDLPALLPD